MSEQSPKKSQKWKELDDEFQFKSDRSVVILGAAYLKTSLGQILESFFIKDKEISAMLLEDEHLLDSFNARIKVAYSLGLISPNEYHDLLVICSIHKDLIGKIEGVRFTDDGIREQCFNLEIPRKILLPGETQIPRRLFVLTTVLLVQQLILRVSQAAREKRIPRNNLMLVDTK